MVVFVPKANLRLRYFNAELPSTQRRAEAKKEHTPTGEERKMKGKEDVLLMFTWIMNRRATVLGPDTGLPLVGLGSLAVQRSIRNVSGFLVRYSSSTN